MSGDDPIQDYQYKPWPREQIDSKSSKPGSILEDMNNETERMHKRLSSSADLDMRDRNLPGGPNKGWLRRAMQDAKEERERILNKVPGFHELAGRPEDNVKRKLAMAAELIIEAVGGDLTDPHFKDTPRRFVDMFIEEFTPNGTIEEALEQMYVEETYDEMLVVRDIPIRSMCPHHLLPWFGRATVGYIPGERTVGLSKITRAIEAAGRGPRLQEAVTQNITKAIDEVLKPLGSMAVIEAVHMCTLMRGVKTELQRFSTSSCTGAFRDKPEARQEFLNLMRGQSLQW